MKPVICSLQWLMLFHPPRRRPVITCHTSNSSPSAPRAALMPPPAPCSWMTGWQNPEATVHHFFTLARIYLDGGKLAQRRRDKGGCSLKDWPQRCEGLGSGFPLTLLAVTQVNSPPSERGKHASKCWTFRPTWLRPMNVEATLSSEMRPDTMEFFHVILSQSHAQCPREGVAKLVKQGNLPGAPPTQLPSFFF